MKIKLKKRVLGNEYIFYLHLISKNTLNCNFTMTWSKNTEIFNGKLVNDFSKLHFDQSLELSGYYNGPDNKAPKKSIVWIKIDKDNQKRIKDYYEYLSE